MNVVTQVHYMMGEYRAFSLLLVNPEDKIDGEESGGHLTGEAVRSGMFAADLWLRAEFPGMPEPAREEFSRIWYWLMPAGLVTGVRFHEHSLESDVIGYSEPPVGFWRSPDAGQDRLHSPIYDSKSFHAPLPHTDEEEEATWALIEREGERHGLIPAVVRGRHELARRLAQRSRLRTLIEGTEPSVLDSLPQAAGLTPDAKTRLALMRETCRLVAAAIDYDELGEQPASQDLADRLNTVAGPYGVAAFARPEGPPARH
jgi:hypothetical protein